MSQEAYSLIGPDSKGLWSVMKGNRVILSDSDWYEARDMTRILNKHACNPVLADLQKEWEVSSQARDLGDCASMVEDAARGSGLVDSRSSSKIETASLERGRESTA